jgi:predicted transcriptional regulator
MREKNFFLYIVLDTEPKSFVDVRTIALKAHQGDEKLKNFKKVFSKAKSNEKSECFKQLVISGDRVILTKGGDYFDFVDGLKYILESNPDYLSKSLSELSKDEIFALNENDKISTARNLFIKHRINILPVIDKNRKLIGEVRPIDLMLNDLFNASYDTADYFDENKQQHLFNLPIENVYRREPMVLNKTQTIRELVNVMVEKKLPSVLIGDEEEIFSVVSYKDIFKLMEPELEKEDFIIEYVHPDDIYEDDLDFIKDISERTFKKIRRISDYDHLKVSFKSIGNVEGSHKRKFEINLSLYKGNNQINVSKEISSGTSDEEFNDKVKYKWNVPLLAKEALNALERKVFEEKKKN